MFLSSFPELLLNLVVMTCEEERSLVFLYKKPEFLHCARRYSQLVFHILIFSVGQYEKKHTLRVARALHIGISCSSILIPDYHVFYLPVQDIAQQIHHFCIAVSSLSTQ